jgi:hypothetical protein
VTSTLTAPDVVRPRDRGVRSTIVAAVVALVVAGGGYGAAKTFGPDSSSGDVRPSDTVMQEMRESITGLYGTRPSAAGTNVRPSAQVMRELHTSIVGQHGGAH